MTSFQRPCKDSLAQISCQVKFGNKMEGFHINSATIYSLISIGNAIYWVHILIILSKISKEACRALLASSSSIVGLPERSKSWI